MDFVSTPLTLAGTNVLPLRQILINLIARSLNDIAPGYTNVMVIYSYVLEFRHYCYVG